MKDKINPSGNPNKMSKKSKFERYKEQGKVPEMNEIVFDDVVKILMGKTDFEPRFYDEEIDEYNKGEKEE